MPSSHFSLSLSLLHVDCLPILLFFLSNRYGCSRTELGALQMFLFSLGEENSPALVNSSFCGWISIVLLCA